MSFLFYLKVQLIDVVKVMTFDENIVSNFSTWEFPSKYEFLRELGKQFEKILNDAKHASDDSCDSIRLMNSYLYSYPIMVRYFEEEKLSKMYEKDLVGALFMVYGWMPTTLRLNSGEKVDYRKLADVLAFLPKLQEADTEDIWQEVEDDLKKTTRRKKGANAKKGNLQTLKDLLGGSVVGLSKLLHFVNPSVFPIYDSKIATVLNKHFTSVRTYIEYAKWFEAVGRGFSCKEGACEEDSDWQRMFEATVKSFENEFDCKITLVRAMELFLFLKGRK